MLRRLSIRRMVIGAMAAVALVGVGSIIALVLTAASMSGAVERQSTRLLEEEAIADELVRHVRNQLVAAERYLDTGDARQLERFRHEGGAAYDRLRVYLFRELGPQERLLVERIREQHQDIEVAAQRLFAQPSSERHVQDLPGVSQLQASLNAFLDVRRQEVERLLHQLQRLWFWLYLGCAALALVFFAVLAVSAVFLERRLFHPLHALSHAARRVGGGDFDARVNVTGDDELTDVALSFNRMAERLHQARLDRQAAEHRFRDLIEGVSIVVWEADAVTLACSYVSPQAEPLFGYPLELWRSPDIWRTLIHPGDFDRVMKQCAEQSAAGLDHVLEYRAVRADGSIMHVREFVRALLDTDGRPTTLRGVLTDVTERHTAEEALAASEQRYHSLVERVPLGLYRTTPDGRILEVNAALVTLLGFASREALLQANVGDLYLDAGQREAWQHMLDLSEEVVEADRQHRRCDGTLIWLRDTARAVRDADGSVLYYEGALQDVTERVHAEEALRRSEARFRSLIEDATDGVVILSAEGMVQYQSPAVARMLGHPSDETLGTSPFRFVHPDDLPEVVEAFTNAMTERGHGRSVEFRARHADGSWRMLHVNGTNLLADPAVAGVVLHMIDATTHRALEAQLQHSQRLEAVGRLAGGLAHDFNNLLTAIRGYTDMLHDQLSDDPRTQDDVAEIRRAVERGAGLTRQLLAFSRRQVVRPQPADLGAVILGLDPMLRRLLTEGVALHTHAVPGRCWVYADPGQLEQIVVNLVVNARDARPTGGIHVGVDAVHLDADDARVHALPAGDYVLLTVADDGCGIQPDVLPFIFEPFFTTKEVGQGSGLGLATVYGIVQDGGGRVIADSTPGGGTRMYVYLPRIAAPTRVADATAVVAPPAQGSELVLLVEDEPSVRSLAERVLLRQGYVVQTATNGVDALRLAATAAHPFELLVTDVVMPGMGGVELAEQLIGRWPDLQVLFMSGYAADAVPSTDAKGRPLHFLEKPFAPATLADVVRRILDDAAQPA